MRFRRGMGNKLNAAKLTQVVRSSSRVMMHEHVVDRVVSEYETHPRKGQWFLARITGSTPVGTGTDNKWTYDFEQVDLNASSPGATARTDGFNSTDHGKAWNLCELDNDNTALEGPGWDLDNIDPTTSFELKPIAACIVQMWHMRDSTGAYRAVFFAPNVIDGECEPPAE